MQTVLVLLALLGATAIQGEVSLHTLRDDLNQFVSEGTGSQDFWDTLEAITLKAPVKGNSPKIDMKLFDGVDAGTKVDLTCVLCRQVGDTVLGWLERGDDREQLVNQTTALCVTTGIQKEHICRGVIDSYVDMFIWISGERNRTGNPIESAEFCGLALYPDCPLREPAYEWTLDLDFLGPKPPSQNPPLPPEGSATLQILQLTDVHVDPNYVVGGNAACDEPTCCRPDQGPPSDPEGAAGYWGDPRDCDMPVHTFRDMIQQAKETHPNVDYVLFTGDIIDHGVWATSVEHNTALYQFVITELRAAFPNVPLLPILGNHEPHPLNVFSSGDWVGVPANVSQAWMYQMAADSWSSWLGPEIRDTLMRGGYYKYQVNPDLLILTLNNNAADSYNWWLMYNPVDPGGQLQWLAENLLAAEQAGQKVHILSHMSGNAGIDAWETHYRKIIDRFENTITAQFFGHTHDDVFDVYYALEDTSRASHVAFSGGSGTPYSDLNPNYKAYTLEGQFPGSNYRVLDLESWTYNLTEANLAGFAVSPRWHKLYSFNEAYGTPALRPSDLDTLVYRMATDTGLQQQLFSFAVRDADSSLAGGCDAGCLRDFVCSIVSNTPGKCDELPWPAASTTAAP